MFLTFRGKGASSICELASSGIKGQRTTPQVPGAPAKQIGDISKIFNARFKISNLKNSCLECRLPLMANREGTAGREPFLPVTGLRSVNRHFVLSMSFNDENAPAKANIAPVVDSAPVKRPRREPEGAPLPRVTPQPHRAAEADR